MGNFARALHHLDMKDVKKRHLKERAAKKIKEENNRKEAKAIQDLQEKYGKVNINLDSGEINES